MGKAARWLKGFLGMKKDKEKERESLDALSSVSSERREKKRWSFGKPARDSNVAPPLPVNVPGSIKDAAWLRSYLADTDREQSKHAIAVAEATAKAADAAVAAAQAAVAVVRLTSQGRGGTNVISGSGVGGGGGRERSAAVKIQTVFRGFLARKALRALKGLVKLQALVRGYLVRKRAAATLHSMQALIRAQTSVCTERARRSFNKENRYQPETRARKSIERYEDARSEFHSKRFSTSYDLSTFDESPKIVEIDTCKPLARSRRMPVAVLSECGEDCHYHANSSPLPCPMPSRISVPDCRNYQDFDWYLTGEECRFSTAQSTPRFANSIRSKTPATPAKSVCGDGYFRPYSNCPSYMANTQSFRAKLRSHSAPKQRPEPLPKKRLSLNEIMASRSSISSIKMQRPSFQGDQDLDI